MEFDWNNYLEDTKTVAVPEELFYHVSCEFNCCSDKSSFDLVYLYILLLLIVIYQIIIIN